ncbi:hypothetical protein [Treponema sp.]|uniref:hypothetical protein n=1 Tax=Treponema sp. TaxID=166 RepID=UPI0025EECAB7|nr:hypothetical protein [Treponema sp.]MCR5218093.1 hypothetical protein [Treponema sp.]
MKKSLLVSFFCSLIPALFFSCRSSNIQLEEGSISPLALLDDQSSIYINIPVQQHQKLFADILCSQVEGLAEKDALSLAERTGNLYAGLGTVKDRSRLEAAAVVDIPKMGIKSVFKQKNDWFSQEYKSKAVAASPSFILYTRKENPLQISFPEKQILCVSKNVDTMLDKYALSASLTDNEMTQYLLQDSQDILFYITRPGQYLRNMIGVTVQGSDKVWGKLIYMPDPEHPKKDTGKYQMEFYMHLQDAKTMKAFQGLMALSFAMSDGSVEEVDPLTLKVSGVEVSRKQINEMFIRKPVTGTHYKVVGDKVYAEPDK